MIKLFQNCEVIVDWIQFLILFLTLIGIHWNIRADVKANEKEWKEYKERADRESKEFWRKHESDLKEFWMKHESDLKEFREKWAQETKDFHGRLIAIEERRNKVIFKE
jgi:hypothetical protein